MGIGKSSETVIIPHSTIDSCGIEKEIIISAIWVFKTFTAEIGLKRLKRIEDEMTVFMY